MIQMLRRARAWFASGWAGTSVIGLLETGRRYLPELWHRVGDVDLMRSLWELSGGDLPSAVTIVASPFFGVGLVIAGLIGLPAVIQSGEGSRLHPVWSFLGWAVFCSSICLLSSILLFGHYATTSRTLEAVEYFRERTVERHLSSAEISGIRQNICDNNEVAHSFSIWSVSDPEAVQYAMELISALSSCGVKVVGQDGMDTITVPGIVTETTTNHRGLFVISNEKDKGLPKVELLLSSLQKVPLVAKISGWDTPTYGNSFGIYVSYR